MTFIYALLCPHSGATRYIGKANKPSVRLSKHISDARRDSPHATGRWIRQVLASGCCPQLIVLFEVDASEHWQVAEKRTIAEYRAAGHDLTNSTSGGQGLQLLRAEDRLALAASLSEAWDRPGARESRRAAILAGNADPLSRARRRTAANRPETKTRLAAALAVGLFGNPEVMARRRASQKAAANDPAVKAAKGAASRSRWSDPAYRERVIAKQKAAWIKRKERTTSP